MLRWFFKTASENPRLAALVSVISVFVVAFGDVFIEKMTGHDYPATALYLFPITMATWLGVRPAGYGMMALTVMIDRLTNLTHTKANVNVGVVGVAEFFLQLWIFFIVIELIAYLRWTLEHERNISRMDNLTGLNTFKAFKEKAIREIERMKRYNHPMSVVYLDVDDFKRVNDSKGHSYGNKVLQGIGASLTTATRSVDITARMGGDEFIVMLPETGVHGVHAVISRLEQEIRDNCGTVTCSIGVATFESPPDSVDDMLHYADQAMYEAKRSGKSRTTFTEVLPTHSLKTVASA
jgi:diguanylate cyclase (GGDEF)-like protein